MKLVRSWISRLAGMLPNAQRERALADEIEWHLQMHIDDNLRSGMSPEQARRNAIHKLGGVESTIEAYRERSTLPFLENLFQDTRFALRQLRKNPGFTATAILMLALGLCASVAIFAFVDAALIKPLPYANPGRLVAVFETIAGCPLCNVSYFNFRDWKKNDKLFSSLDAWSYASYLLRTPTGAQPANGTRVSDGFFRTLGVTPILGRDFYAGEDAPGAPHTVLLSFAAWQNRFGGRPDVVGQAVTLTEVSYTVVGVLPREFHFAPRGSTDFWVPLNDPSAFYGGCEKRRGCHSLFGVARLKDGVSIQTALAGMKLMAEQLGQQYPDTNRGYSADVLPHAIRSSKPAPPSNTNRIGRTSPATTLLKGSTSAL
jgi:macrolide transport system ATP-binding/permease protein